MMNPSSDNLRHPRLTSGVLGSLAIVLGAALVVLRSIPQESWVVVAILALSAGLIAGREWLAHREAVAGAEKERLSALRCPPTAVRDTDPFAVGVTPSEIADRFRGAAARPPYVSRDIDAEFDRVLRDSFFVAVVGPSKAGKSRTAFEAISRVFPQRLLIAPEMPGFERDGLADAVAAYIDSVDAGAVIWLDDLQEFLRAKAIATQDINAWRTAHPKVVVVATVRDGELAALRDSGLEVERIVDQAQVISLPSLLSARELKDASAAYPDEDFGDGIGVHLVAGQRLVERLVSGRGANPAGYAIACAAIDRQRAGLTSPAGTKELITLAEEYWHGVQPHTDLDEEMARGGIAWAAEPVIQDIGLLLRRGSARDLFEPFEYVVAYRDGEVGRTGKTQIPPSVINALIEHHGGWDLRAIGYAAMVRQDADAALRAFRKLIHDPDPHIAAHALEDLGRALASLGDEREGRQRTEEAAECDYPCVFTMASYRLACDLVDENEEEAERLYRRVLEHPDMLAYPRALVNLGLVLRSKTSVKSVRNEFGVEFHFNDSTELSPHDVALEREAQEMFEAALESDDVEAQANGGQALGVLLNSRGQREKAIEAFEAGMSAGSTQAQISLARVYARENETLPQARELLDQVDDDLRPDVIVYKHGVAAEVAMKAGTIDEEIEELRRALTVSASHSTKMRLASFQLAREQAGDLNEAIHFLKELASSGSEFGQEATTLLDIVDEYASRKDRD